MSIDINQLRELLAAIALTDITELNLKTEDFELMVRKEAKAVLSVPDEAGAVASVPVTSTPTPVTSAAALAVPAAVPTPTEPSEPVPASPQEKDWVEITSPMVGTFYRAPTPGETPFVEKVGDTIRLGQTVCIIEAMKLMNEIEAEIAGEVMDIVVENGEPVEYGQTLMWIKP